MSGMNYLSVTPELSITDLSYVTYKSLLSGVICHGWTRIIYHGCELSISDMSLLLVT